MTIEEQQSTDNLSKVNKASISWHNIKVSSTQKRGLFSECTVKPIIKDVSGSVKAGRTLAIMGSSGAGKTTLLNVLTARNLSNFVVTGVVKINNQIADVNMITSMSAYVQQQDLFIPVLTVREHLIFQSMVRMAEQTSDEDRIVRVQEVMQELGLDKCADTIVGGTLATGKGISGGETKRLAFAVEILTNPSILFCDEPTSGLDSFMAAHLVSTIDKLAKSGRTVICTIHQPSSEVFNMFQNLLLMADGRVAYQGKVKGAVDYFQRLELKCPMNYNPADFYIHELAIIPGDELACREKVNRICEFYNRRSQSSVSETVSYSKDDLRSLHVSANIHASRYKVSWVMQYKALSWRAWLITKREPMLTYIRVAQAMILAVIIAIFFYNQQYDQRAVMNINGALFLFLVNLTVQNAFAVINVFCQELPILLRENNSGMYSVGAYFFTKNLAETLVFVIIPMVNPIINYYAIGFNPAFDAFLFYIVVGISISMAGVSFGYFISCVCSSTDVALAFGPPIIVPLQLLGGFFINPRTMPKMLSWCQYLSWFYYAFSALVKNQWEDLEILDCQLHQADNSTGPQSHSIGGCIAKGTQVIDFLGEGDNPAYLNFSGIIITIIILRFSAYLALLLRAHLSR